MICSRCQGLMWPSDLRDEAGGRICNGSPAFRCVLCGDLVDSVILANRTLSVAGQDPRKGQSRFHHRGMRVSLGRSS